MPRKNNRNSYNYRNIERDVRDIQRAGKRFKKSWINADGPLERILILLVVVAVIGVTIGMLLPKVNPTVGEITGEYTATGTAAETLEKLTIDDNPTKAGYDRDAFGFRETDDDGNGCDVREDVLARDLTDVQYKNGRSCQVASGTLDDPYTGQTIQFVRGVKTSSAVQIDHVVALEMRGSRARTRGIMRSCTNSATTCTICWPWMGPRISRRVPLRPHTGCRRTVNTVAITWPGRLA